jgi:site-specific recombinase XerD
MPKTTDPTRACLHVHDWPLADQTLWKAALAPNDLEDDGTQRSADWRPTTRQTLREGYGRWLAYLKRSDVDLALAPADRVTQKRVSTYLKELEGQGLSAQTRCNRIAALLSVMQVFASERDWGWLRRRMNRLAVLAEESRPLRAPPVLSGDVLGKALNALTNDRVGATANPYAAVEYRNWLMVAMLTLVPLRRHNFAGLSLTDHLRQRDGDWRIEIPAADAKTRKPIVMPIPKVLHPHLRFYLEAVRPVLLAGASSDRLWITVAHTAMTDHSFWVCITNFTKKMFGIAINPHCFRHIGATSAVIAAPGMLESARALLAHGDSQTTQDHYLLGQSIAASRKHADLIRRLRRELPAPEEHGGQVNKGNPLATGCAA